MSDEDMRRLLELLEALEAPAPDPMTFKITTGTSSDIVLDSDGTDRQTCPMCEGRGTIRIREEQS